MPADVVGGGPDRTLRRYSRCDSSPSGTHWVNKTGRGPQHRLADGHSWAATAANQVALRWLRLALDVQVRLLNFVSLVWNPRQIARLRAARQ